MVCGYCETCFDYFYYYTACKETLCIVEAKHELCLIITFVNNHIEEKVASVMYIQIHLTVHTVVIM